MKRLLVALAAIALCLFAISATAARLDLRWDVVLPLPAALLLAGPIAWLVARRSRRPRTPTVAELTGIDPRRIHPRRIGFDSSPRRWASNIARPRRRAKVALAGAVVAAFGCPPGGSARIGRFWPRWMIWRRGARFTHSKVTNVQGDRSGDLVLLHMGLTSQSRPEFTVRVALRARNGVVRARLKVFAQVFRVRIGEELIELLLREWTPRTGAETDAVTALAVSLHRAKTGAWDPLTEPPDVPPTKVEEPNADDVPAKTFSRRPVAAAVAALSWPEKGTRRMRVSVPALDGAEFLVDEDPTLGTLVTYLGNHPDAG